MITKMSELVDYLANPSKKPIIDYLIAVEGLIFDSGGKLILVLRSDRAKDEHFKLEGIGGAIERTDDDLHTSLKREIKEELGAAVEVSIDKLLEVRSVQFTRPSDNKAIDWVVVSYLCRLVRGTPINNEPEKHLKICHVSLEELQSHPVEPQFKGERSPRNLAFPGLSKSLVVGRKVYAERYGNQPYFLLGK